MSHAERPMEVRYGDVLLRLTPDEYVALNRAVVGGAIEEALTMADEFRRREETP